MSPEKQVTRPGADTIQSARWLAADESLRDAISRFATQARFEDNFINAFLEFWGADDPDDLPIDLAEETPEFLLTVEWYLYDYRDLDSDERMIDLFAQVESERLGELEKTFLAEWRQATLTPFEVSAVEPGAGFTVHSLIDGEPLDVDDEPTSRELRPGDLLVARLLPAGAYLRPSSVFRTFSASDQPRLMAALDEWYASYQGDNEGATWNEFLREEGYLVNDYALERQALTERLTRTPEDEGEESDADDLVQIETEGATSTSIEKLEARYLAWVDRPTPALAGLSPRQAVAGPPHRNRVIDLLREMGQIEASYALVGEPAFEIAALLPRLGLNMNDLQ
jgi:hypothetical protein